MIIAYSKLGRSWNLDPRRASTVGGDMDVIRLLMRLAWNHPEHTFLLLGRNSGEDPQTIGYPGNVVNPWTKWQLPSASWNELKKDTPRFVDDFLRKWREISHDVDVDRHIMWLGQHGTSNSCIPNIGSDWGGTVTTPQASMLNYCSYLLEFCRRSYVPPILLCPDPRNYIKARELTHGPSGPVLAQFDMKRQAKFEQFDKWGEGGQKPAYEPYLPGHREGSVWVTDLEYTYTGLELTALDEPPLIGWGLTTPVHPVGLISNENRKDVGRFSRLPLVKDWLLSWCPEAPMFGKWSEESEQEIGRVVESVPASKMYDTLRTFRTTITFPASGSGWATAKPWEAFAAGTVIFFHPGYDVQGHILPIRGKPHWTDETYMSELVRDLSDRLRVDNVAEFRRRVELMNGDAQRWVETVRMQRDYFELAFKWWGGGARRVEEALCLP